MRKRGVCVLEDVGGMEKTGKRGKSPPVTFISTRNEQRTMNLFETDATVFRNEHALTEEWVPNELPEREDEVETIANAFNSTTRTIDAETETMSPSSILVSGKAGQGKTAAARYVLNELEQTFNQLDADLHTFEISLKDINTDYQAVGKVLAEIEEDTMRPPTGYSLSALNNRMFERLNDLGGVVVFFFDEVDNLGGNDDLLYQLSRGRDNGSLDAYVSVVGVSNDIQFSDRLSAKAQDSFHSKEVHFDPYNADELRSILDQRIDVAFKEGVVREAVPAKASAITAKDTGSARQAIRLLYESGDVACANGDDVVTIEHLEQAQEELEDVDVGSKITDLTLHDQMCLLGLALLETADNTPARTKEIYSVYRTIAADREYEELTQRTIRKKLINLDTYNLTEVHKQRGGIKGGDHYVAELGPSADSVLDGFTNVVEYEHIASNPREFLDSV